MIRHLTARQAAELLGRNVQDVKRLCRTDQLPGAYKTSVRHVPCLSVQILPVLNVVRIISESTTAVRYGRIREDSGGNG